MLPDRLTWIDETNRDAYHFLDESDRCLFFGDFNSGRGWRGGPTNQLIHNLKRTPTEIETSQNRKQFQYYKEKAISDIASAVRKQFDSAAVARQVTFVPIPSSKVPGDPDYCDRLERVLQQAFPWHLGYSGLDIRPLLRQTQSTVADHRSGGARLKYEQLLELTQIDQQQLLTPTRATIVLFDDVLTSGKHYKVAKTRIREALPNQDIVGVFVARAIHANPFEDPEDADSTP